MSRHSHKSTAGKIRPVKVPQRANGKLRVAAILEATAEVIAEKGYDAATMAEIAARSGTKVGSLYRFFPNKQSLADTLVVAARENLDAVFDQFDSIATALSIRALTDELLALLLEQVFTRRTLMKLLDAGQDWSVKREAFRDAVLRHIAKTLVNYSPGLSKKRAGEIALVILLCIKAWASNQEMHEPSSTMLTELRDMTRLYLQSRLGSRR